MRKGYIVLAAVLVVGGIIALIAGDKHGYIPVATGLACLLLGADEQRSSDRHKAVLKKHGLPIRQRKGWF